MRQKLSLLDEPHLQARSLSVDYSAGTQLPMHEHSWCQLVYCVSGSVRCEMEGGVWILPPRRAIWLPVNETHALTMLGDVKLRTLYLPEMAGSRFDAVNAVNVSGLLHEAILRTCQIGALDGRVDFHAALLEVIREEVLEASSNLRLLPMPIDPRGRRLAELFLIHSPDKTMVSMIADAGLTRRTAERIFADETGLSPARWYRQARLTAALPLLLSGQSVVRVAERCGYQSSSSFSKAFSLFHGVSPSDVAV